MCWRQDVALVYWRWEYKMVQPLWNIIQWFLKKIKIDLPYDLTIFLLGMYLKEVKSRDSKRYLDTRIHSSIIHSRQKLETTQVSTDRWTDKQNVVLASKELLFSHSFVSNSLWPHGLKHTRRPCPSLSPRVCSNSCPLNWWCHPSHLILCRPLLLLSSILPNIRAFSNVSALCIRWPKYWSFSFCISPSSEYSGLISFRISWFDLLSVKEFSRVFSSTTVRKHQFFGTQLFLWSNSHIHTWLLEKL